VLGKQLMMLAGWFSQVAEVSELMPLSVLRAGVDALVDNAIEPATTTTRARRRG